MATTGHISYRKGLKYQLFDDYSHLLPFAPEQDIITDYIEFYRDGRLIIRKGYAWDGPSGPTVDDEHNMRGSCVHDSGYQLERMGLLPQSFRDLWDKEFKRICLEDKMGEARAEIYFLGVHIFGEEYAKRQEEKIYTAPPQKAKNAEGAPIFAGLPACA